MLRYYPCDVSTTTSRKRLPLRKAALEWHAALQNVARFTYFAVESVGLVHAVAGALCQSKEKDQPYNSFCGYAVDYQPATAECQQLYGRIFEGKFLSRFFSRRSGRRIFGVVPSPCEATSERTETLFYTKQHRVLPGTEPFAVTQGVGTTLKSSSGARWNLHVHRH